MNGRLFTGNKKNSIDFSTEFYILENKVYDNIYITNSIQKLVILHTVVSHTTANNAAHLRHRMSNVQLFPVSSLLIGSRLLAEGSIDGRPEAATIGTRLRPGLRGAGTRLFIHNVGERFEFRKRTQLLLQFGPSHQHSCGLSHPHLGTAHSVGHCILFCSPTAWHCFSFANFSNCFNLSPFYI